MNRREVRWERMFPDELEAAFAERPVAYLPYGLCEPHGPQNALGNDALRAHATLCRVAHQHGGIVCPPEYWHCHELGGYGTWGHHRIGGARTWLTAVPPWIYLKNLCYHVRTMDMLGFHAAVLFSGHSGPHRLDVPIVLELLQAQVDVRIGWFCGSGTGTNHFDDGRGVGGHAGRGETSQLWSLEPACVDLSRLPGPDVPGPHFAMGDFNESSSRRVGDRMTEDVIARIHFRADELLAEYAPTRSAPMTFGEVEAFWDREIQPRLSGFASLQAPAEAPPPESPWRTNWTIPAL